ncbi:MAG: oxygen-independent coproporphyrinogen III oxidase [Clostridium sp.]|nr:oxygen-independent coproporphyrinogen III oxidase [Clostridium sp.]
MDRNKSYGLYIHIPFCAQKCYYCDFASYSDKNELVEEYLDVLAKEINLKTKNKLFDTIFIGGGTPSFLSKEQLEVLGKTLKQVSKTSDYEFTMECNPGNLTRGKALAIRDMGINRLSIGLQTSNDEILIEIGRIHTFRQFEENYHMLREMGFDNINVDLIYALPHETKAILEKTLSDITRLKPDHISCYSLIIEEFTPFHERLEKNTLNLPSEEVEREMHDMVICSLKGAGYDRYEISNYALDGKVCRHNIRYWEGRDYVGCGVSAHEYVDGVRDENHKTIEGYLRLMDENESGSVRIHKNTLEEDIEEYIFMGMRMVKGLSKKNFKERFQMDIDEKFKETIEKHTADGLLINTEDAIKFTEKGMEFSNHVLVDFLLST